MICSVSIAELVDKLADIATNPKQLFFYVPLDIHTIEQLTAIRKEGLTLPTDAEEQDFDHVTLLYIPKSETDIAQDKVDSVVRDARAVAEDHAPIKAKIQGWAYFDGAKKDGEDKTALVGLIDAPGLEDLHVELKSLMKRLGFPPSTDHSFTPHVTFAYLSPGARVESLPKIGLSFDINKAMLVNGDKHELPLRGRVGVDAAKAASWTGGKGATLGEAAAWMAQRRRSAE